MTVKITPGAVHGTVAAIDSKSDAHRLLLAAALSKGPTVLELGPLSKDLKATVACIRALGAEVAEEENGLKVTPIETPPRHAVLQCGESGSTLRFLVPVAAALGVETTFLGSGRLPTRPLNPLREQMQDHGLNFEGRGLPLSMEGMLKGGVFRLPGNISSQYITGLLFALPLVREDSQILLTTELESRGYLNMTLDTLQKFGVRVEGIDFGWHVPGGQRYHSPGRVSAQGDWSNGAAWLTAAALTGDVTVENLSQRAPQGDRAIMDLLKRMGAVERHTDSQVTVERGALRGLEVSAANIPDLVPLLAVAAAGAQGETRVTGAARLRLKESDRLQTVSQMLRSLGGRVEELPDGLVIQGGPLRGGTVDGEGDHRIVMAAAVAGLVCENPVEILGAEAVEKSYPAFFEDFNRLTGGCAHVQ